LSWQISFNIEFTREQDLSNYILKKDYVNAILLAISLRKPYRVYKLFDTLLKANPTGTCSLVLVKIFVFFVLTFDNNVGDTLVTSEVERVVSSLGDDSVEALLGFARDWNAQAKTSLVAHIVLSALIRTRSLENLLNVPSVTSYCEALLAYSGRHLSRLDDWIVQSYFIDYSLQSMDMLLQPAEDPTSPEPLDIEQLNPFGKRLFITSA
jgi:U3 small nucleolar RNA-associated protein 13